VDDNSPDDTSQIVRKIIKDHPGVHMITGKKEGLGKAILRGMKYAIDKLGAQILVQMDADLSHDPDVIPKMIEKIDNGADFVVGSRYIPGGSIPENWGLHRKIFSVIGNAIVRYGLGHPKVHDWTGGFRVFRKEFALAAYDEMERYNGYVFQIAFLHKSISEGAKVEEEPIHFTDRKYGRSKIAPSEYIRNVFEYVIRSRWKSLKTGSFGKFLVVGGIGFLLNALFLVVLHNNFKINAPIANIIGAIIAIFSNYNLNNRWTFKKSRIAGFGPYVLKLIQFYATSAFGVLVIQTGTITLGVRIAGDSYYFMFFLAGTALLLVWNYFMYSRVIWKNPSQVVR
jgi:dolichol-phosphate mannosyltransferase